MRLFWKSHKLFPLVSQSILPAAWGAGAPVSAARAMTSGQNPPPRKPLTVLHF